jgi:hypothetical protein
MTFRFFYDNVRQGLCLICQLTTEDISIIIDPTNYCRNLITQPNYYRGHVNTAT